MNYTVIVPRKIEKLVNKKLTKLEKLPKASGKPLRSPLAGIWELYFEKRWRILFEIYEDKKIVLITGFKHKDEM